MRSLGNRRAAMVAAGTAAAAVALAGCSAGQVAETAIKQTSAQGANANNADNTVAIRDFDVSYNGVQGYPSGANAPLEGGLYNLTTQPVTVLISSRPPADTTANQQVVGAQQIGLVGGTPAAGASSAPASALPSASGSTGPSTAPSTPAQPAIQPARITLPPSGFAHFQVSDQQSLQVVGLSRALMPGQAVNLVFEFSNGAPAISVAVPVGIPLTPAPRASGIPDENEEPNN